MKKSKKLIIAVLCLTLVISLGLGVKCLTQQTSFAISATITENSYQDYYQPYYDKTTYQASITADEQFQARGKTVTFSTPENCYDVVMFRLHAHYGSDVTISYAPEEDVQPIYHSVYPSKTIELELDEYAWYSIEFIVLPKASAKLFEGEVSILVDGVDVRIF